MKTESLKEFLFSREGLNYQKYRSPVGDLTLLSSADALIAVLFEIESRLRLEIHERFEENSGEILKTASDWLDYYFHSGGQGAISVSSVQIKDSVLTCLYKRAGGNGGDYLLRFDLDSFSVKEAAVYAALLKIPQGETVSYADLGERAGFSKAGRFIGNAMAKNLFPIFIPCHRVIRSDRSMGQYSGGIEIKRFLLNHEGAGKF